MDTYLLGIKSEFEAVVGRYSICGEVLFSVCSSSVGVLRVRSRGVPEYDPDNPDL